MMINENKLPMILGENLANKKVNGSTILELITEAIKNETVFINDNKLSINTQLIENMKQAWTFQRASVESEYSSWYKEESCQFLLFILYRVIYQGKKIPLSCKSCYKVKININTVYALSLIKNIAKKIKCHSKCGTEETNKGSSCAYAAYFYVSDLNHARKIHLLLTEEIHANEYLSKNTKLWIKRGCTPYETEHGRSDQWQFDDSYKKLESELFKVFTSTGKVKTNDMLNYMSWITTAYSLGDESYLKLTNGKRRKLGLVDYSTINDIK